MYNWTNVKYIQLKEKSKAKIEKYLHSKNPYNILHFFLISHSRLFNNFSLS